MSGFTVPKMLKMADDSPPANTAESLILLFLTDFTCVSLVISPIFLRLWLPLQEPQGQDEGHHEKILQKRFR